MRYSLFFIVLLLASCNQGSDKNSIDQNVTNDIYVDTTEKHFDCIVNESFEDSSGDYIIVTECGLYIRVDSVYMIGDTLKGFYSPKHK
jgi:hypothetical protein